MNDLTGRQQQTLGFITEYLDANGCPPTLQEIAGKLGITGNLGVMRHLRSLERKGYLHRRHGARGIVLTGRSGRSRAVPVPIVGSVRAGLPTLAVENIEEYCATDPAWLKGEGCFYLTVRGDSMIGAPRSSRARACGRRRMACPPTASPAWPRRPMAITTGRDFQRAG